MFEFESNGINSKKLATILLALGFALIMHKGKSEVKNPKKYKPLISDIKSNAKNGYMLSTTSDIIFTLLNPAISFSIQNAEKIFIS